MDTQKVTPVDAAGPDPAFIPGLTPPRKEADEAAREPESELKPEPESESEPEETAPESDTEVESDAEADADAEDAKVDGPAFSASDRRGSITADATGIVLQLDDQEAEFRWDEVGAVEVGTSRRRLTVTVHTPDSRWYPNDVEAPDKARAQAWADDLDKVLDAYFED
ncbi:hypothetical protein EOT10_29445 [Streptomyces antnestii]|uniref:Uncharacterized protein n=1 Tax=Streptomyces antnestii TaxID=2494256 RepID=A0A3S2YUF8_9ACTN|nr:hypothetical protein EOT10_29445 [Streptomyces sp. San01]